MNNVSPIFNDLLMKYSKSIGMDLFFTIGGKLTIVWRLNRILTLRWLFKKIYFIGSAVFDLNFFLMN